MEFCRSVQLWDSVGLVPVDAALASRTHLFRQGTAPVPCRVLRHVPITLLGSSPPLPEQYCLHELTDDFSVRKRLPYVPWWEASNTNDQASHWQNGKFLPATLAKYYEQNNSSWLVPLPAQRTIRDISNLGLGTTNDYCARPEQSSSKRGPVIRMVDIPTGQRMDWSFKVLPTPRMYYLSKWSRVLMPICPRTKPATMGYDLLSKWMLASLARRSG
jgi:hypothetical protein